MIRRNANKLALLCALLTVTAASPAARADDDGIIARGEGATLGAIELKAAVSALPPDIANALRLTSLSADGLATELTVRKIIAARARGDGIDAIPEVAARLQQAVDKALYDEYMERSANASIDPKLVERLAREEFRASPERFRHGEQVHVRHILVKTCECAGDEAKEQARLKAENILARIKQGESFEDIAAAESDDPGSAKRGGDLGFLGRGQVVPPFEEAAFALKPGELGGPVESGFGFHILRLEEKKEAGLPSFEDVRERLVAEIGERLKREARSQIVTPLRAPEALKIDAAALREAVGGTWSTEETSPFPFIPHPMHDAAPQ
ncbi:MAG: peptidylprolyl isomerase [Azoarcus sp.]|jgi:peptidyl-prolyl cis-trans isomerase C|nr:peptidylprolyl isomerase [Azoarcus sp.]